MVGSHFFLDDFPLRLLGKSAPEDEINLGIRRVSGKCRCRTSGDGELFGKGVQRPRSAHVVVIAGNDNRVFAGAEDFEELGRLRETKVVRFRLIEMDTDEGDAFFRTRCERDIDFDLKRDARFGSIRQPVYPALHDGECGQHGETIFSALMGHETTELVMQPELSTENFRDVDISRARYTLVNFLQGDEVWFCIGDDTRTPVEIDLSVHAAAMADIVGKDTKRIRRHGVLCRRCGRRDELGEDGK